MVISAIVVVGVVLYTRLSVDLFPDVNFPMVTVTTVYPGAAPETMETQVSDTLEEAINSISGIRELRSTSIEGVSQVVIMFALDRDLDVAAQEVRDQVATVRGELPNDVRDPIVQKLDLGAAPILRLALHGDVDQATLLRHAEDDLKPALERLSGVGQVDVLGGRERELHVWIDPSALREKGLVVTDVVGILGTQNLDLPGGRVRRGEQELVVRTDARVRTPEELGAIVLLNRGGAIVRLRDVARIEDGFEEARSSAELDGENAVALVIRKQSDANTVVVAEAVVAALPELRASAPAGADLVVVTDESVKIRASIETVQLDLVLGAVLAVVIIFVFLRDPRATLISALALPTSVIGTFAFIQAMGFTLNLITTLALSLSIGILIDDAIVVIENIVRHRAELHEKPMVAAQRGTAEIGLAVLATTFSLVAVFVPVAFMEGLIGQFFYQFGLTVTFAVLISLFVSFTLTPMLSSRFLGEHSGEAGRVSAFIERRLSALDRGYRGVVAWALRHRKSTMFIASLSLVAAFALAPLLGFEFLTPEDTAQFEVKLELPSGTNLEETRARARDVARRLRGVPGVRSTFTTVGGGVQEKVNTSVIVVGMIPHEERSFHQTRAMAYARELLAHEANMQVVVEVPSPVAGGARNAPIQLDLMGDDLTALSATAERIAAALRERPGFVDVDTSSRGGKPELRVVVDRQRAGDLGIASASIAQAVRFMVAGQVATRIDHDGDRYDVRVQLPENLRRTRDLARVAPQLRTASGQLVDFASVARFEEASGPSQIDRYQRHRLVTVYANLEDLPLGDAMNQVRAITESALAPGVSFDFGGNGKMLAESITSMGVALFLAIIFVYMILASQFESFIHPFTIMVSLPFAVVGALFAVWIMGMSISLFAMIGFIMLMGLVTKNAILLVDFAIQKMDAGLPMLEALEQAGATRLRPILMTTLAMVFGMLPAAMGHGQGGEVRAPMGVIVIGGLITSTMLTLVVVPVVFTYMESLRRIPARIARLFGRGEAAPEAAE
ncbi:MAG: efflux RND transporter permease subunit [Deltaproteobacteria bacterium]|nr:efflux RND transporter permease subunit [Deltaproteobacteria bacterium]